MESFLGSQHIHIDALATSVSRLVHELRARGLQVDITPIKEFATGPQRENPRWPKTYELHTPGVAGERFDSVVTIEQPHGEVLDALPWLLDQLQDERGAVVEVERIVALVDEEGDWREISDQERSYDQLSEIHNHPRLLRENGLMEIHFAIRVAGPLPTTEQVRDAVVALDLEIGGVFLAEDGVFWTNAFTALLHDSTLTVAMQQHGSLFRRLTKQLGVPCTVTGVVEQVLGICKIR